MLDQLSDVPSLNDIYAGLVIFIYRSWFADILTQELENGPPILAELHASEVGSDLSISRVRCHASLFLHYPVNHHAIDKYLNTGDRLPGLDISGMIRVGAFTWLICEFKLSNLILT